MNLVDLDGAVHALFMLEEIYGLYPVEADGHVRFAFRDSVAVKDFKTDLEFLFQRPGYLLQLRAMQFQKACAAHDAGKLTDEEYALWKSKFPEYWDDFQKEVPADKDMAAASGGDPIPVSEPQTPERVRQRKINSGRRGKREL